MKLKRDLKYLVFFPHVQSLLLGLQIHYVRSVQPSLLFLQINLILRIVCLVK